MDGAYADNAGAIICLTGDRPGKDPWSMPGPLAPRRTSCDNVSMKNITVSLDDEVHRRARIKAAERGTSLSAAVREFLVGFAGGETDSERRKRLQRETLASVKRFRAGDRLTRDDSHDRRALR
jgi:plasmid stability protein